MAHLFISYSRLDSKRVEKIVDFLADHGLPVWIDRVGIEGGEQWRQQIVEALQSCDVFVLMLSPNSLQSDNVRKELDIAERLKKRVVPVQIAETDIPPKFAYQLAGLHREDMTGNIDKKLPQLFNVLSRYSSGAKPLEPEIRLRTGNTGAIPRRSVFPGTRPASTKKVKPKGKAVWIAGAAFLALGGLVVVLVIIGFLFLYLPNTRSEQIASTGMVEVPYQHFVNDSDSASGQEDYWIDRYEVTNSQYAVYVSESSESPPAFWGGPMFPTGQGEQPVRQITWQQAKDYCRWLGKRLPTQQEWLFAARGPYDWPFPWGNDAHQVTQEVEGLVPVSSNAANRSYFGAYFMSGNVWEWVEDEYAGGEPGEHVLLGGSFGARDSLSTIGHGGDQSRIVENAGIRCAVSAENVVKDYHLAIHDDFDLPGSNWPKVGAPGDRFIFNYHDPDYYHLETREPDTYVPSFYELESFNNFILETGVFVDSLNTDNQSGNFYYGLAVRHQDQDFTAFLISSKSQEWRVYRGKFDGVPKAGPVSDLTLLSAGMNETIQGASEEITDRLGVLANGTEMSFLINGEVIHIVDDIEGSQRNPGFFALALDEITRIHIHYNWVTLENIEAFRGVTE